MKPILTWVIPRKYRGVPMMVAGLGALYLTTWVPFSWLNLLLALAMICTGPVMYVWGSKRG